MYVLFSAVLVCLDGVSFDAVCRARLSRSSSSSSCGELQFSKWRFRSHADVRALGLICRPRCHSVRPCAQQQRQQVDAHLLLVGADPMLSYCALAHVHTTTTTSTTTTSHRY